jgi:hypothetical protein
LSNTKKLKYEEHFLFRPRLNPSAKKSARLFPDAVQLIVSQTQPDDGWIQDIFSPEVTYETY